MSLQIAHGQSFFIIFKDLLFIYWLFKLGNVKSY